MAAEIVSVKIAEGMQSKRRKTRRGKRSGRRYGHRSDCATLSVMDEILQSNAAEQPCSQCVLHRRRGNSMRLRPRNLARAPLNSTQFLLEDREPNKCNDGATDSVSPFYWGQNRGEYLAIINQSPVDENNNIASATSFEKPETCGPTASNSAASDADNHTTRNDITRDISHASHSHSDCAVVSIDSASSCDSDYESFEDDTVSFMIQDFESTFQNLQERELWELGRKELVERVSSLSDRLTTLENISVGYHYSLVNLDGSVKSSDQPMSSTTEDEDVVKLYAEISALRNENEQLRSMNRH